MSIKNENDTKLSSLKIKSIDNSPSLVKIFLGDKEVPVTKLTLDMEVGCISTVTITVPISSGIDVDLDNVEIIQKNYKPK